MGKIKNWSVDHEMLEELGYAGAWVHDHEDAWLQVYNVLDKYHVHLNTPDDEIEVEVVDDREAARSKAVEWMRENPTFEQEKAEAEA